MMKMIFQESLLSIPPVFTITYVGTLSDIYPVDGFLNALQMLKEKGNEFILRFIGTVIAKSEGSDSIKNRRFNSGIHTIC